MKYEYQDTDGQNFIIEDTENGICECFTSGTVNCIQKSRFEDITVFTEAQIEDIFNSDGREIEL